MNTNTPHTGSEGYSKVDLSQAWSLNYWFTILGCSIAELTGAVGRAGSSVQAIRNYLEARKRTETRKENQQLMYDRCETARILYQLIKH